jgi:hypothetical protein
MHLPFTPTDFFAVFARYNTTVWPLQIVFVAAAVLIVVRVAARRPAASPWVFAVLAALWLWMGLVYHGIFFRAVNPAAPVFGGLFVVQAALLARAAGSPGDMVVTRDWLGIGGAALVLYGLAIYPLAGYLAGHRYPASPTFGLPCPTTLFTVGVLLWMRPLRPRLMVIPVLWSVIGFTAAFRLGVYEDIALAGAAVIGVAAMLAGAFRRRAARGSQLAA